MEGNIERVIGVILAEVSPPARGTSVTANQYHKEMFRSRALLTAKGYDLAQMASNMEQLKQGIDASRADETNISQYHDLKTYNGMHAVFNGIRVAIKTGATQLTEDQIRQLEQDYMPRFSVTPSVTLPM